MWGTEGWAGPIKHGPQYQLSLQKKSWRGGWSEEGGGGVRR